MRNLQKKLKKQGGFTLVEMLIVVAIIAILVAVAIPIITVSLQKTQHATDLANERSAKMEIMAQYLLKDDAKLYTNASGKVAVDDTASLEYGEKYAFDAANGVLLKKDEAPAVLYGKCECNEKTGDAKGHTNSYIKVSITEDGIATVEWDNSKGLCSDVENYKHETKSKP